ncbi:TlpA family protein disulfide reductase [Methylomonas sp. LL1]|uniref:peroxiredoxin family protein n=1 Tax=Methylomonas sp. LL1 TaxID=2785785 RepID=UPI0018C36092|nr:TlpA family protein disulfide reductase [Methylomonas sp. LL1]QPK61898.1 TlpA family protein disulfide reductase [Methylomonas sp. LL1]
MNPVSKAKIGCLPPDLSVSGWVQGEATNFEKLAGRVVLVEMFQVNCPGCFLYSLPQAIDLHQRYADQGLAVLAVATAFEDFDKNTLQNLVSLTETGQLIGETLRVLTEQGQTRNGRWRYRLPFPVAMDRLVKMEKPVTDQAVEQFIQQKLPDIAAHSSDYRQQIRRRVLNYLQSLEFRAETFERFDLQGTPSHVLVDKQGILLACRFGAFPELESLVRQLIADPVPA